MSAMGRAPQAGRRLAPDVAFDLPALPLARQLGGDEVLGDGRE